VVTRLNAEDRKAAEDFIDSLEGLDISWILDDARRIRTHDFTHGGAPCCPLEASYAEETGKRTVAFFNAARHYNLSLKTRLAITEAADNHTDRDPELRQRMLEKTGLAGQVGG